MSSPVEPCLTKLKSSYLNPPDHPFGRENQVCVRQLFKFFCNNLYLGQWELARACVKQLHQQNELLGQNIHEVLFDVTQNPYGYCLGNDGVSTPHHLSSLCVQEYSQLQEEEAEAGPSLQLHTLQKEVEFRLLLVDASEFCDTAMITEMYLCYTDLHNNCHPCGERTGLQVSSLSEPCLQALGTVLEADPELGRALLVQLRMPGDEQLTAYHEQLLQVHLNSLSKTLSTLQAAGRERSAVLATRFYRLLALFAPNAHAQTALALTSFLEQLSRAVASGHVSAHGVYSALLGREAPGLVAAFCRLHHTLTLPLREGDAHGNVEGLSETGHLVMLLCKHDDRQVAWKRLFLVSLEQEKHFMDLIMDTAMCLVRSGEFARLSAMLDPPELRPLRPLVLLVGWDHCPTVGAAQRLLSALGDWQMDTASGTVIERACQRLSYQVELVQWCLGKVNSLCESDDVLVNGDRMSLLLRGLETHSVLTMLHRSKQLARLTHAQVVDVLTQRPHMRQTDAALLLSSMKKSKCVRFAFDISADKWAACSVTRPEEEEEEEGEREEGPAYPRAHVETERDLAVYRSYRALHAFMEAMYFCADTVNWEAYAHAHNQLRSVHRARVQAVMTRRGAGGADPDPTSMPMPVSSAGPPQRAAVKGRPPAETLPDPGAKSERARTELAGFQVLYAARVGARLAEGRQLLAGLYPLKLRVETLENIFSLLFLTNEHLSEECALGQSDSGEEGEEGAAPDSRRGSQADNLSILFESSAEKEKESCRDNPPPIPGDAAGPAVTDAPGCGPGSGPGSGPDSAPHIPGDAAGHAVTGGPEGAGIASPGSGDAPGSAVTGGPGSASPVPGDAPGSAVTGGPGSSSPVPGESDRPVITDRPGSAPPDPETRRTEPTAVDTFCITKADLKDTAPDLSPTTTTAVGSFKKASGGNQSTNSACSTGSVYKVGFAANPYIVRDLLATLKESLGDLNAAKYRLTCKQPPPQQLQPPEAARPGAGTGRPGAGTGRPGAGTGRPGSSSLGTGRPGVGTPAQGAGAPATAAPAAAALDTDSLRAQEDMLNKHLTCSLSGNQLQQRSSRLAQCVSEASWRFQLVAPPQMPAELGTIQTDTALTEEDSQSDDEPVFHGDDESRHKRRRYTHGGAGSTEDDCKRATTTTTTDDSFGSLASRAARHRKRSRTQCLMLGRGGVMSLMLSDKTTLLNRCLKGAKYSQAQQVIKMFGLERSENEAEVMFAEHYAVALKTLQNLNSSFSNSKSGGRSSTSPGRSSTSPGRSSTSPGRPSASPGRVARPALPGTRPSLSAIADVAAAGMVTVSATTTVDQILSLNLLPRFPADLLGPARRGSGSGSPLAAHVDPALVPSMVILDLACAGSRAYDSTNNLVQMMSQRLPPRAEHAGGQQQMQKQQPQAQSQSKVTRVKRAMSLESVSGEPRRQPPGGAAEDNRKDSRKSGGPGGAQLPGVRAFMERVLQWVHAGRTEVNIEVADAYLKRSLNDALLTASQPFGASSSGIHGHLMVELGRSVRRVQKAVHDAHKQETLSLVQAVRAGRQGDATDDTSPGGAREKPVIRQAMKQLLLTFSNLVPSEGVSRHLLGLPVDGAPLHSAYLPRLYDHVKALSCLVHEAHGDKLVASTVEYFQILEEGPTQILGKLIFVKRIPPARLEDVATKLHVNMLQIIINNCCPLVSSRPLLPAPPVLAEEEQGGKLVLNGCADRWIGSVQHPGTVVTETLTKLIGLLRDLAELDSPSGVLGPGLLASAVHDPRYPALMAGLTQLRHVDLRLLASREDKICFYVNLVNLMTLHVLLRQVQRQADRYQTQSRSRHSSFSSFNRQASHLAGMSTGATPGLSAPGWQSEPGDTGLPVGDLEWLLLQSRTAYYIGQLGIVSLFDLKYFILRNGLPAPSSYGGIIKDRCHELDQLDPWRIYGPQPEPRTLFVISDGHVSSPPLQVLSREMVLVQLRRAMKDYLQRTITVDLEANMVTLPQLVVWHQCDLATENGLAGPLCEGLLNLLPTQLDPPLADDLRTLMDRHAVRVHDGTKDKSRDIQVMVQPYIMEHTYTFDFDQFSRLQSSTSPAGGRHRRCASLPWTLASAAPTPPATAAVVVAESGAERQEDLFHLTPAGMSYLRSRSELIATLASLVGLVDHLDLQKDLIEEADTDADADATASPRRTQSPKEEALVVQPHRDERSPPPGAVGPDPVPARSGPDSAQPSAGGGPDSTRPGGGTGRGGGGNSPASPPPPSARADSDYTIAEYRYRQQLERLPRLWRHLLQQVVPLEMARDPDLLGLAPEQLLRALCDRELGRDSRTAALVSPADRRLHAAVLALSRVLILQRDWLAVVRLLRALPELLLRTRGDLRCLHDLACCCVALAGGEARDAGDMDSNDLWRHLLVVADETTRRRTVLSMARFWPVDVAVELLEACYHGNDRPDGDDDDDQELRAALGEQLQRTCVYRRVTEAARTLHRKAAQTVVLNQRLTSISDDEQDDEDEDGPITMSTGHDDGAVVMTTDDLADLESLCTWQNVVTCSECRPERVLHVLLTACEFDVARTWGEMHQIDASLQLKIEERYIAFLLESSTPNQTTAFQVLERLLAADPDGCLSLCGELLASLQCRANTAFIASFILRHLADRINKYRYRELELLTTGCRMLLCLPESARDPYSHLVGTPLLLLEQLLMNSQVEWVSKILGVLRDRRSSGPLAGGIDGAASDAMLVRYAARALDFPVLQAEPSDTRGMVHTESRSSITSHTSNASHFSRTTPIGGPMGVSIVTSPSCVTLQRIPQSSSLSLQKNASTNARSPTPSSSTVTSVGGRRAPSPGPARPPPLPGAFVLPPEPPPKDQWVPDGSASVCMVCGIEHFSMFVRRHHCRRCGRVVCAGCSTRTLTVNGVSARACDQCYEQCFLAKDIDQQGRLQRLKDRLSGASSLGSTPVLGGCSAGCSAGPPPPTVPLLSDYMYVLSADDEQNDLHREDFYYDQAPSTSLCLSLLELHSCPQACGDTILALCDDVSKHLQPVTPGVRNHEVDYGLVLSMLKYLLFNAKMKLLRAGDNAGVERCEVYLGRLDLLRQLVAANVAYVPSMQQLTKMDALRRLRDRLIHEERLPLAMDVSTKCGIDPTGVWAAWGMAALRAGDYSTARDKFSHCLKPSVDRNSTHQSAKLLADIIEQIESGPPPSATLAESLLAPLASLKDLLAEPHTGGTEPGGGQEEAASRECVHYLTVYGSHTALVAFYLRHGQLQKALHHILDKRCSREVFVEGLLVPCLVGGKLTRLLDAMQLLDPTLEVWAPYVTAICRHLDKARLLQTLYQTQLFVKDYIRAAMTCITYFYQQDADSYSVLSGRVHHLLNAKHHLECYLGDRAWARVGQQASGATLRLIMTPGEVNKYINTISLQIDVTKFLLRYGENLDEVTAGMANMAGVASSASSHGPSGTQPAPPPTLFGSTRMKAEAANLVLLSGNNVNDGFGLAFRIIQDPRLSKASTSEKHQLSIICTQDFKLDATFIYVQAARYVSRLRRYSAVLQLLACVKDSGLCTDQSFDDVITASVRVIADNPAELKEADALIKMIRSDASKVSAYMACGKLRSAYLVAVKAERVEDIQQIRAAAERTGQVAVKKICDKWLAGPHRTKQQMPQQY